MHIQFTFNHRLINKPFNNEPRINNKKRLLMETMLLSTGTEKKEKKGFKSILE